MSKPINKTLLGGFVIGALVLVVAAIVVIGSGKFFTEKYTYMMVFEGSVNGLDVGAPVHFRGVKFGSVSDIRMHLDYQTKAMVILVYAQLGKGLVNVVNLDKALAKEIAQGGSQYAVMQELIQRGLRARLENQSIVTGKLQIGLDFYNDTPAVYTGLDKQVNEIPTTPTPLQELAKKLESLNIDGIAKNIQLAADGIAKLAQSLDLKESVTNLNATLKDIQSLVRHVDAQVTPLGAGLSATLADAQKLVRSMDGQVTDLGSNLNQGIVEARAVVKEVSQEIDPLAADVKQLAVAATQAMQQFNKTLVSITSSTEKDSELMYGATEAMKELENTLISIRALVTYLDRHPEALLRGKGGN